MLSLPKTELEIGRRALEHVRAGRGRVLVISGEPGIGKSALARAILDEAEPGARVVFGRAWEVGGAPPYWPWTQALADLGSDLAELLGSSTGEMAGAQRVVAFQRVTRALVGSGPLAIALDDLHAADTASLELALAVARGIARHPILIVATTRESELLDSPVHAELVGKLAREGERIALRRLDEPATSAWLAAIGFQGDAREVFRLTEGNPLFVEEAARTGIDRWTTGGVSVMLREHISRVSPAAREILAKASVLGREIRREDVAALAECDLDAVANAEREALRTNILAPAKMAGSSRTCSCATRSTTRSHLPHARSSTRAPRRSRERRRKSQHTF